VATVKKRARNRNSGLTEGHRIFLKYGFDFLRFLYREKDEAFMTDTARQRELWRQYGKQIFADWMKSQEHPCRRPWGWWKFDAPGQRLVVERRPYKNMKGEPEPRGMWPDGHIETHYDIIESQEDALERLGLLEPWEESFLEKLRTLKAPR